jgi:hypothetical protein
MTEEPTTPDREELAFAEGDRQVWEGGHVAYQPNELIDAGDKVLAFVRVRGRGKASGVEVEADARLTVTAYVNIEAAVGSPGWSTVERIAGALGVSMEQLGKLKKAEDRKR